MVDAESVVIFDNEEPITIEESFEWCYFKVIAKGNSEQNLGFG